ncbi:hypothetical protein EHM69_00280 [candidate division KSB1 bacterium]|nr:MAG: hypothetical protein EHM69_00280 [candidate division KSB1 bacterium]
MRHRISNTNLTILLAAVIGLWMAADSGLAQERIYRGNTIYRAKNTMSGNLVRSVFYNYGLVGNIGEISGEWPIGTGNEYVGDVSPLVGVQFVHPSGDTMVSVTTSDGPRQNPDGPPGGGTFWGFEPLEGFNAVPIVGQDPKVAMSNQPDTWPEYWPDKNQDDERDHGWRKDMADPGWQGAWNGYFGKNVMSADQETYFQMDDHADGEWFQRTDSLENVYYYYPSIEDSLRRGLGLRVLVRGMQWAHFLAQDCIFWLYEITNISSFNYDKVCFGMIVGTLSGGRQDSEDDLAYFDLENDITYSWDSDDQGSLGWVSVRPGEINVGYVGYAFLESPGNPVDGIDNDGDSDHPGSPTLTASLLYEMTQPQTVRSGQPLILMDYNTYQRSDTVMTADSLIWFFRDQRRVLRVGDTLRENGRNNIDDNFNGLIDERFDSTHIDHKYRDYFTGQGLTDPLIDEARDDGIDNDGDWNPLTNDVGFDGVAGTGDIGEGDGQPTDGEPNFDKTDVDESDQIGLTSFYYFTPPGAVRMRDDQSIWTRMIPGNFDVIEDTPMDGDFVYGSGYFPLRSGQTERFSMALLYGENYTDIRDNKITVQQIYDENYNFARPPDKPKLWTVPGDGKVTLYWDSKAEDSYEPICDCKDFEGYKIYRATDPSFNEVFSVTDGLGRRVFHRPIAQFDLDNGNGGFFPIIRNAVIFNLGDDTGLRHSWTDTTVENGQTYYYAVVAYDRGDIEKQILPAENSKTIVMDEAGNITLDINTAVVTPRAPAAGYEEASMSSFEHASGSATGAVALDLVDPRLVRDNVRYDFTFANVPDSISSTQTIYSITRDSLGIRSNVLVNEPLLPKDNLLPQTRRFRAYYDSLFNRPPGLYDPIQYFQVAGTPMFDGQIVYILIPRDTALIAEISGWEDTTKTLFSFTFQKTNLGTNPDSAVRIPMDYEIEWFDHIVDTTLHFYDPLNFDFPAIPVNFSVKNISRDYRVKCVFVERSATRNGTVDANESLILFDSLGGQYEIGWNVGFVARPIQGDTLPPGAGDKLTLHVYQPYTGNDLYVYGTRASRINADAVTLDRIKVYPNPYVAVSPQEPTNLFNEGRGERRITFIHLPNECTIRIYTVRGDLIQEIRHFADIDDGHENWDLRSRDGQNVAYGTYLYHIESPFGEKTGRFAVIK